jgi:XTP/dITP diphosphohydrolase
VPIVVATKNRDKFREIETLWGAFLPPVVIAGDNYPDVDENGDTYEQNAVLKAWALAELVKGPALADDSGIEVEAMGWGPGVRSARTPFVAASSPERNETVLRSIAGKTRKARFVSVCALVVPGYQPVVARGEVEGLIAEHPMGTNGFGYDPIFWYPPYAATFGQIDSARKHAVSHRGNAIHALQVLVAPLIIQSR